MNNQYNYTNLKSLTSDLHNLLIDNELNNLKIQAIKELLGEELEKNKTITVESNDYNLGIKDELEYITSKINKIIGE